jgi:outer membrane protein assembly factor BamA
MTTIVALTFCLLIASAPHPACYQAAAERNRILDEAKRSEFTVRRVEFVGLTYTHDQTLRERMTPIINEGDVLTREKLVRSLRRMSGLKRVIYPIHLKDVALQVDRQNGLVDMAICFRQRPRVRH